jgi:voltage-gated potassium channel
MNFVQKKVIYIANRMYIILILYVASLLAASMLFAFFEGKSFGDGYWWAVVTALTIGYGDLTPVTTGGRITGILFAHFWILGIIPMIIVNLMTKVLEDKSKFTHAEQEYLLRRLDLITDKLGIQREEQPPDC